MTRLLVLGGSSFVGRALVEDGVHRGWDRRGDQRVLTAAALDR
jgi:nucleoside-diphosphate-sugar epimerase